MDRYFRRLGAVAPGVAGCEQEAQLRARPGPDSAERCDSQGWRRHSLAVGRDLGSRCSSLRMKSCASALTSSNSSSGKSSCAREMLQNVSWSVSPPNGEKPVRRTYTVTPRDHMSAAMVMGS